MCSNPLDNGSCLLLTNIGDKRDDEYELSMAGLPIAQADQNRLPCLSERATFMSPHGYQAVKQHPYAANKTLKGHLLPTTLAVPGYSFEAVPFRWLSRVTFEQQLWEQCPEYDPALEDRVKDLLGYSGGWLMDGRNQRLVMDQFFENVVAGTSLVFVYLKHSPLQDASTQRLLVGAAMITDVRPPSMWNQSGEQPFDSSMWETIVQHSLRPSQDNGILLPYQELIGLLDAGEDISTALAWAPADTGDEFSYVTEHVSDDTAIAALVSLRSAAVGARQLGLAIQESSLAWLDRQIDRLWQLRGPAPGLAAVLEFLGVEHAHHVAQAVLDTASTADDPWKTMVAAFDTTTALGRQLAGDLPASVGLTWRGLDEETRDALVILSAMEVTRAQVTELVEGHSTIPVTPEELVANPYFAATCTYRSPQQITFATVDRACFPSPHVLWPNLIADRTTLTDPGDRRRVEALMVDVLETLAAEGDTIAAQSRVIALAAEIPLTRPCAISTPLVEAHGLDAHSLEDVNEWGPLESAVLAGDQPAYKLTHLAEIGDALRYHFETCRQAKRFVPTFDTRAAIDTILDGDHKPATFDDEEELARQEKAAGLAELFSARLSVLVGAAGTGKTTLLRALADIPDIHSDGVLLLAPTGKARVQLQTKVDRPATTLASFLVQKKGFDPNSNRYVEVGREYRTNAGLVVIDEASMLTEEMLWATLSAFHSIKRLVLVGDPRQLPPIGPGRPFVDLVEWLRPSAFDGDFRVAPGYVELTVTRRQQQSSDGERDDLALARWFGGGDLPIAAEAVWQKLRDGTASQTLAYHSWRDGKIAGALVQALEHELELADEPDKERAFALTYGAQVSPDEKYVSWRTGDDGTGAHCEDWQILSPTRSREYGTVELNRLIKRTYRQSDLEWAQRRWGFRPPKPIGPEQIVYGDKVMQTRNHRAHAYPAAGDPLNYVANGEIGVVVSRAATNPKFANVEFSSQPGFTYGYRATDSDDPWLELAWAVTIHKSQGSEFGTTFLVLPARTTVSRELLYTALTRQTGKVIVLHEGTVEDLVALTSPAESETARRLTDLFAPPAPREVTVRDSIRRYDANLIHLAPGDILVRSKNEVIVASILEHLAPGRWQYERPLHSDAGGTKYPDFTIETLTGEQVIWEHLGLMNNPRYAREWEQKKQWYIDHGFRPYDDDSVPGPRGTLMWTDDRRGVNEPKWRALAEQVLGAGPARPQRRIAKKAAPRRR